MCDIESSVSCFELKCICALHSSAASTFTFHIFYHNWIINYYYISKDKESEIKQSNRKEVCTFPQLKLRIIDPLHDMIEI